MQLRKELGRYRVGSAKISSPPARGSHHGVFRRSFPVCIRTPAASRRSSRGVARWNSSVAKGLIDRRLIEKMKLLAEKPLELYRGRHVCELCIPPPDLEKTIVLNRVVIDPHCSWARWVDPRSGNGEIRVLYGGVTFAAPVLIVHYIEEHSYLPPGQFLKAIEEAAA